MQLGYRGKLALAKVALRTLKGTGFYDGYWAHWRGTLFDYAQRLGLHVMPVHYYSPVPAIAEIEDVRGSFPIDDMRALERVSDLLGRYSKELSLIFECPTKGPHDYDAANDAFSPIDAGVLYGMIRDRRPGRIIEIGSGNSTLIAAAAIRASQAENADYRPDFTCVEPYMPAYLAPPPPGVTEVLEQPLQSVPLERFDALRENDMLFIDSSHVVSYRSDVVYEFLEILPRLKRGVLVHVHDIFLPYDYPAIWLKHHRFFWNEQYLLQAFLSLNPHFDVTIPVHAAYRTMQQRGIPAPVPLTHVIPASFWFVRT